MISTTSEHALRALVRLACCEDGSLLGGKEMAAELDIPPNYLSKVLLTLRNAGTIDTTRGQGGGYRLIKDPKDIPLIDVVELFEGISTRPHCFLGEKPVCSDEDPCPAHQYFKRIRESYIRYLEKTTIFMLAKNKTSETKKKV
jgi:Rrf2 family protein